MCSPGAWADVGVQPHHVAAGQAARQGAGPRGDHHEAARAEGNGAAARRGRRWARWHMRLYVFDMLLGRIAGHGVLRGLVLSCGASCDGELHYSSSRAAASRIPEA
jgi:hypothetical protein